MCGRFNIIDDPLPQLLMEITGQSGVAPFTFSDGSPVASEYNVAPTQSVPVMRYGDGAWTLSKMRWWLVPSWSQGPSTKYSMFNAKAETLAKSRAYREPFARRRCIVPVTGYYEWKKEAGQKVPYYIEPMDAPGFCFAGLWDTWQDRSTGEVVDSCTIVTTAATAEMSEVHHRMPVHFTKEQIIDWVSAETEVELLHAMMAPSLRLRLSITPVSTIVNNARNKDERCVEAIAESRVIDPRAG